MLNLGFVFLSPESGSDSAPHPTTSKQNPPCCSSSPSPSSCNNKPAPAAGVFTQPFATQYVILALEKAIRSGLLAEEDVTQDRLEGFLSAFGRRFYKLVSPSSSTDSTTTDTGDDAEEEKNGRGKKKKKEEEKEEKKKKKERIVLERKGARIPDRVYSGSGSGSRSGPGTGDGSVNGYREGKDEERIEVGLIKGGEEIFSLRWVISSSSPAFASPSAASSSSSSSEASNDRSVRGQ